MINRRPDYNLSAFNKATNQKGPVGAAWRHEDGSIRIVLNYLTVFPTNDPNLVLTLFPANASTEEKPKPRTSRRNKGVTADIKRIHNDINDEIPF